MSEQKTLAAFGDKKKSALYIALGLALLILSFGVYAMLDTVGPFFLIVLVLSLLFMGVGLVYLIKDARKAKK